MVMLQVQHLPACCHTVDYSIRLTRKSVAVLVARCCPLWGLATTVLPWFTNFPGFGWGLFGVRAPKGTRPLIAPAIAHACYGLGLGLVLTMSVARHGI